MERIGDILVRLGSVDPDGVLIGLQQQRYRGGSIGTALLEAGAISEDQLAAALAEQHGVPAVSLDELRTVSQETADILDAKVARRCHAVPIRQANGNLVIAMSDPSDLAARDELRFALDREIEVRVAPDFRIVEAQDRLYHAPLPDRYRSLLDRVNRQRYLWNDDDGSPNGTFRSLIDTSFSPVPNMPVEMTFDALDESIFDEGLFAADLSVIPETTAHTGGPKLKRNAELLSIDELGDAARPPLDAETTANPKTIEHKRRSERRSDSDTRDLSGELQGPLRNGSTLPNGTPSPAHEPLPELILPVRVRSLQDAREHLADVDKVNQIAGIVLGYLDRTFHRTVLFKALSDRVAGWTGLGHKIDPRAIADFELSLREPSIFRDLADGTSFYLGPLAVMPSHRKLAACWRGEMTDECLLLPIRVRQRLVAVCYVDRGSGGLKQVNLDRFQQLAGAAGEAMERCILRKKKG